METRRSMYKPVNIDCEVACHICEEYIPANSWIMEDPDSEIYICMNCWHLNEFVQEELDDLINY